MPRGIARRIDRLGRVVVPSEIRKMFGIRDGDELDILVEGDGIVLRKVESACATCGGVHDLRTVADAQLCRSCAEAAARTVD